MAENVGGGRSGSVSKMFGQELGQNDDVAAVLFLHEEGFGGGRKPHARFAAEGRICG